MSMITEQVNKLREYAHKIYKYEHGSESIVKLLEEAADTIEQLAAKVRENNAYQKAFADIKAEIDEKVLENLSDGGDDWFTAEKVNECLAIIDKHNPSKAGKDTE